MRLGTVVAIVLSGPVALLAYFWIAPLLPIGPEVRAHERAFESHFHLGMRRSDVIAAAKQTGGEDVSGENWPHVSRPDQENIVEVSFGIITGFGTSHWKDYDFIFDRSDRLKKWSTGEHDSAL